MRAIVAQHLVVAVTAFLLGCSDSFGPSGSTTPTPRPPDQPIPQLAVTPTSATIDAGKTVRLVASDGVGVALPPSAVSWTSSNTEVASVGADGIVRGRRPGQVQIAAAWNGAHAAVQITVRKGVQDEGPQL
jgi:hypothetical protein